MMKSGIREVFGLFFDLTPTLSKGEEAASLKLRTQNPELRTKLPYSQPILNLKIRSQ